MINALRIIVAAAALLASGAASAQRGAASKAATPEPLATSAGLSGKVGVYSAYFIDAKRLRHQRYELSLRQVSSFGDDLKTKLEGRFRADAALDQEHGTYRGYTRAVRDDEYAESDLRLAVLDWLIGEARLQIGVQQIDWVESLSPKTSDVITPLDLRHGGFGSAIDVIEPVFALNLNHKFLFGALDWLVVPQPKMHRYPVSENGYGYSAFLQDIGGDQATVERRLPSHDAQHIEAGLRYLMYFDNWDATLLAYHGHQRTPASRVFPISPTQRLVLQDHPEVNTFGGSLSTSSDAVVTRLFTYIEPERTPAAEIFSAPAADPDALERSTESRQRIGIGVDYVHSKHFKFYSESMRTATHFSGSDAPTRVDRGEVDQVDYVVSLRLTNETWSDWLFSLEGSFFSPNKAYLWAPEVNYTYDGIWRVALGGRLVQSLEDDSALKYLRDSSHAYLAIHRLFNVQ